MWVREGEKTLVARVKEACADLGNTSQSLARPVRVAPADRWLYPRRPLGGRGY